MKTNKEIIQERLIEQERLDEELEEKSRKIREYVWNRIS